MGRGAKVNKKAVWKHGYKVVQRKLVRKGRKGVRYFSVSSNLENPASVIYTIGKTSRPHKKNGPLAVFDTLLSARNFYYTYCAHFRHKRFAFIEVFYTPSRKRGVWDMLVSGRRNYEALSSLPPGTKLADRVKAVKVLKNVKKRYPRGI